MQIEVDQVLLPELASYTDVCKQNIEHNYMSFCTMKIMVQVQDITNIFSECNHRLSL